MSDRVAVIMPDAQQEGTRSVIQSWLKQPGAKVTLNEPLLEISTDKVVIEIPAPASGILSEIIAKSDEEVSPGLVLGYISTAASDTVSESSGATQTARSTSSSAVLQTTVPQTIPTSLSSAAATELSPAVRKLLSERKLEPTQITGSGRGGRITHEDVLAFLQQGSSKSPLVPHSQMRRSIANHMVHSLLKTAPHVTAVFDADFSAVIAHREKNRAEFEKQGQKLTFTSYLVRASVLALQAVPEVNSRWHDDGLELFTDINIGIATSLEKGLIVPVIPQAQKLDLAGIALNLQDLTSRARESKLTSAEVNGGTFTITNHGVSGSLIATPIINQPQSAILGIGKLEKRPVVRTIDGKDEIVARPMVYVTLTIDHRVLDGFQANTFLSKFVSVLESWE